MSSNALVKSEHELSSAGQIARVVDSYRMLMDFVHKSGIMRDGTDYGKVPGSDKPSLMKPGAEKLGKLFGLKPKFIQTAKILDWTGVDHGGEPFFHYEYTCRLYHGDPDQGGTFEAEAIRSCNSWESKYRWRWVPKDEIPLHLNHDTLRKRSGAITEFDFAIQKGETSGKYGKPAVYWQSFQDAINNNTARRVKRKTKAGKEMDAWEIGSTMYRIPNDDIFSQVNTLDGMAQKRAYVSSMLIATSASEFFTLDIEDFADTPPVHSSERQEVYVTEDGEVIEPAPQKPRQTKPTGPQLPANGIELRQRLGDYDGKLAAQKICGKGELLSHIAQTGVGQGWSDDLAAWDLQEQIIFAAEETKRFETNCRSRVKAATAVTTWPGEPGANDPDGVKLYNWLRKLGSEAHRENVCTNEEDLLDYVRSEGNKDGCPLDIVRWQGDQIRRGVECAKSWVLERRKQPSQP